MNHFDLFMRFMHRLLRRNDNGEVSIRWSVLARALLIYIAVSIATVLAMHFFTGRRFSILAFLSSIVVTASAMVILAYVVKRHAEGRSIRQFSLSALLAVTTVACLFFGIMSWQRQLDVEFFAKRQQLQQKIMSLVGKGTVHVNSTTLIQVKRPSFNDDDLIQILKLRTDLAEVGASLWLVDFSGTSVTDRGVNELAMVDSLEYCYLIQTGVTDASLEALGKLPNLKTLQVSGTRVTPGALMKLSASRPNLDIAPKP